MTDLQSIDGLTARDVMHTRASTIPASSTVADVREYFSVSTSRRLALLADGERFVGAIGLEDIPAEADAAAPAAPYVAPGATVRPDTPAAEARDLALATPLRRVPVIDDAGALVGIVAIDADRVRFCG